MSDDILLDIDEAARVIADASRRIADTRRGSRFVDQGADPALVRHVASGGEFEPDRRGLRKSLADGDRLRTEARPAGIGGKSEGLQLLRDVRALRRGDFGAFERLRRTAKAITDGELLVRVDTLAGYVEARQAAGPVRGLAREFEVSGREVRMLLEGDPLNVDWTPEGGLKPSSDASVVERVAAIYKPAGVTTVPDELLDDSDGLAERLVSESFGKAIGKKIDQALLDGDGIGKPLGVLRAPGVNHDPVTGQTATALYDDIIGAVTRLRAKSYEPTAVVMRPEVAVRFDTARTAGSGEFLFTDWQEKIGVSVVFAANLPLGVGDISSIVVADWRSALYVLARQGLAIESSPYPGFEEDVTTFRAHERLGAAVVKPEAVEVLNGVDLTP